MCPVNVLKPYAHALEIEDDFQLPRLNLCVLASLREIILPSWRDVPSARKIKLQSCHSV